MCSHLNHPELGISNFKNRYYWGMFMTLDLPFMINRTHSLGRQAGKVTNIVEPPRWAMGIER